MTTEQICDLLHKLARQQEMFVFPFEPNRIPRNGIYFLFETDEKGHNGDRIVRIGTHTGQNQLRSRLNQHFLIENKDRSVFRKNIGRSLLSKDQDGYLKVWESDMTTKLARSNPDADFDFKYQQSIEDRVSFHIRNQFRFVVVEVPEKEDRLRFESGLISLVCKCCDCGPSTSWLGRYSPKDKIRNSGLWQVNELYKTPVEEDAIYRLFSLD